jgi:hypothetical protein
MTEQPRELDDEQPESTPPVDAETADTIKRQ